ncbi:hypothetical protein F5883DRAFT_681752 [Diaporthe sp. PMI_573]|nr:hypothetical protein F5883DRAFT_681752 [Diaporthaceae sp. PMI_573]
MACETEKAKNRFTGSSSVANGQSYSGKCPCNLMSIVDGNPAPRPQAASQKGRLQNLRPDASTTDLGSDNRSNDLSETSPASVEHTYGPDFGMYFAPQDGQEPYFPGILVEIGWSHPLPDWKAKRYIRYGKGHVRYVMALNVEHRPKEGAMPNITIHAHEIASDEESWFPRKSLHAYDVRANAELEALTESLGWKKIRRGSAPKSMSIFTD